MQNFGVLFTLSADSVTFIKNPETENFEPIRLLKIYAEIGQEKMVILSDLFRSLTTPMRTH